MGKRSYVFATGGLGNQLFQVAAALGSGSAKLIVLPNQANARKNKVGNLDIEDFNFSEHLEIDRETKLWLISQKGINYTIRHFASKRIEKPKEIFSKLILLATSALLTLNLKSPVKALANRGLGFDPIALENKGDKFYIGYFQSFKFLLNTNVRDAMQSMRLKNHSNVLEEFSRYANSEVPLIVHVRMGDYSDSNLFGILPKRYYSDAINHLWSSSKYKKIWLFSDEPDKAINQIPENLKNQVRVIPDFEGSTPITFEVMRLGRGYVIANSSFSWWAASLTHSIGAKIAAPDVWFEKSTSPEQILPPHWIKFNAWK
jgi:hypothetical protein